MSADTDTSQIPQLEGDAAAAVRHRGSHLQIIAAAGSGKTEVVSQRVADLLADGFPPRSIVAFTFTERAAAELKNRVTLRVEHRLGRDALDQVGGIFIGTIHSYCFQLLQRFVPRYETYDVLDENQVTAFLAREAHRLGIRDLDGRNRLFASIGSFLKNVDVVDNELLDPATIPDPFGNILRNYLSTLERYRLLTYGQQVVRAVRELEKPEVARHVHAELRHLIVDEYQDVNPAQERLVALLVAGGAELCVVGDDDQAIYQWRGSDVSNIVNFADRYPNVRTFAITTNRRSRPTVIQAANQFATTIPGRIAKTMGEFRQGAQGAAEVAVWWAETELDEAGYVADLILRLNDEGVRFRDMAVLVRSSASYPRLVEQFATFDIPVQPGGRSGLFDQPEARALGRTFCWLSDIDWREQYRGGGPVEENDLVDEYTAVFDLDKPGRVRLRRLLHQWRDAIPGKTRTADLVGELYTLLDELDVRSWDLSDPRNVNRMGTLARFSALLADYESVRRRARPDPERAGEQIGGEDRGPWYYKNLAIHLVNYAQGEYEGFDGEPDFELDAVDLTTVHRAKGLEWPVVFVPSATAGRFPTVYAGRPQPWLVPRELFSADRYEGSDADERRLFYVAMTRARDWLSVSRHERVTANRVRASPYWSELAAHEVDVDEIELPRIESAHQGDDEPIQITYSDMAAFLECGMAFRLRNLLGFQPRLAPELGYGKAVHHVMRAVAEFTQANGRVPSDAEVERIFDADFFLPTANKAAHRQLKAAAKRLVAAYKRDHQDDLQRVWETERPFELHLEGVIVSGRADVILDKEDGVPTALAIVDYKTSTHGDIGEHALQLQVYADAGRREGLDVRAAYVHDLAATRRESVPVDPATIGEAEDVVTEAAVRLRARDYRPTPGPKCRRCEVRTVCPSAVR